MEGIHEVHTVLTHGDATSPVDGVPMEQDPLPSSQVPTEPTPVEPAQVEPTPVEEMKVGQEQIEPTQVETMQVEQAQIEPTQLEPTQLEPTQVEPAQLGQHIHLEEEVHILRDSVRMLQEQNEQLQHENSNLKNQLAESGSGAGGVGVGVGVEGLTIPSEHDTTATAAAAAHLSNYQNALALSETQKSQLINEIQALRSRLTSLGYSVDVTGAEGVGVLNVKDGDASAAAAAAEIDIAEAEVLMAIDPTGAAHAPATHVQTISPHQHVHMHPTTPGGGNDVNVLTPNTAGLSSRSEEKWEMHFIRLSQYKAQHGNCLVPTSTELGRWLCRQRHNYRYKNLKEDRKQRLMELDKTCLGERVADLTSPIQLAKDADGNMQNADGSIVTGSHLEIATTLNSKTKYNQAYESKLHAKWDRYFQELVAYNEKHGHCNFPTMNGSLGRWISRQRTLYRSKKLKTDRYEKLKNLGFAFEDATALEFKGKLDQQWEDMYAKLLDHRARKGHCFDVPETWPLGKWLYRQRWLYRHGNLREDRAKKLLEIGFEDKKILKKDNGHGKKKRKRDEDVEENVEDTEQDDQNQEMQEELNVAPPQAPKGVELEHHVVPEDVNAVSVSTVTAMNTPVVPAPTATNETEAVPPLTVPLLVTTGETDIPAPTVPPPITTDESTAPAPTETVPAPFATAESAVSPPTDDHAPIPVATDETPVAMDTDKTDVSV